jgi:hypothetical protein
VGAAGTQESISRLLVVSSEVMYDVRRTRYINASSHPWELSTGNIVVRAETDVLGAL